MKVDSIIFDLDGTLWDTCHSCAVGWNNVIKRHHIQFREVTAEDIRSVAGEPHEECIRQIFNEMSEADIQLLIEEISIEDNRIVSDLGGELYPGVKTGLQKLNQRFPLFIVSNCQSGYIETFLKWSGLSSQFQDFECWGNTGLSKSENLKNIIKRNDLRCSIFAGDTQGDADAAKNNNIPFAFAQYGFGRAQDFDIFFHSFDELCDKILLNFSDESEALLNSAIETKLKMSYEDRIESHEAARQLATDLMSAGEKLRAES